MYASIRSALPLELRQVRRRFVAVDIENINGGAVESIDLANDAWQALALAIGLTDDEIVVAGVGPSSVLATGTTRPSARLAMGRGISGADHALIELLRCEQIADRFDEVVIASGDGEFADVAAWLGSAGIVVTVVAREERLSKRLRLAAANIVLLPEAVETVGEAA